METASTAKKWSAQTDCREYMWQSNSQYRGIPRPCLTSPYVMRVENIYCLPTIGSELHSELCGILSLTTTDILFESDIESGTSVDRGVRDTLEWWGCACDGMGDYLLNEIISACGQGGSTSTGKKTLTDTRFSKFFFHIPIKMLQAVRCFDGEQNGTSSNGFKRLTLVLKNHRVRVLDFRSSRKARKHFVKVLMMLATKSPIEYLLSRIHPSPLLMFQTENDFLENLNSLPHRWISYWRAFSTNAFGSAVRSKKWRCTDINIGFQVCPSYPEIVCVPSSVNNEAVRASATYRGGARFPILSYYHSWNGCCICRAAQPHPGLMSGTNWGDDQLVEAILNCNITHTTRDQSPCFLSIVDLRPYVNAMGNRLLGGGYEDPSRFPNVDMTFHDLPNIHHVRNCYKELSDTLLEINRLVIRVPSENPPLDWNTPPSEDLKTGLCATPPSDDGIPYSRDFLLTPQQTDGSSRAWWRRVGNLTSGTMHSGNRSDTTGAEADFAFLHPDLEDRLRRAQQSWHENTSLILKAALFVTNRIHRYGYNVLVHCSDGWDRTPQVCCLAQLMLDGSCRTIKGFLQLIEKEWFAYGHKFSQRIATAPIRCDQRTSSLGEMGGTHSSIPGGISTTSQTNQNSPVFLQFLDCVYQVCHQNPTAFEFSTGFLAYIAEAALSGCYINFVCDTLRDWKTLHDTYPYITQLDFFYRSLHPLVHRFDDASSTSGGENGSGIPHLFRAASFDPATQSLILSVCPAPARMILWCEFYYRYGRYATPMPVPASMARGSESNKVLNQEVRKLSAKLASTRSLNLKHQVSHEDEEFIRDLLRDNADESSGNSTSAVFPSLNKPSEESKSGLSDIFSFIFEAPSSSSWASSDVEVVGPRERANATLEKVHSLSLEEFGLEEEWNH